MLLTLAIIFLIVWLLGMVSAIALGNFIHVLLVLAIVFVLVHIVTRRRPN